MVEDNDEFSNDNGVDRTHFIVWDLTPVQFADSMGLHLIEDAIFWCQVCG